MSKVTTTAELVASLLDDDGMQWKTSDGRSLEDLCQEHQASSHRDDDVMAWNFPDGSTIVAAGAIWDLGYSDCYCWRGNGHDQACVESTP